MKDKMVTFIVGGNVILGLICSGSGSWLEICQPCPVKWKDGYAPVSVCVNSREQSCVFCLFVFFWYPSISRNSYRYTFNKFTLSPVRQCNTRQFYYEGRDLNDRNSLKFKYSRLSISDVTKFKTFEKKKKTREIILIPNSTPFATPLHINTT